MNNALNLVDAWGLKMHLKFNPSKTIAIMFTNKRAWKLTNDIVLSGHVLKLQNSVKYLGVTLDSKLTWSTHVDNICQKANINLHRCRQAVGSTWGLSPKTMYWMFTAIIRPILSYGAIIWITSLKKKYIIAKLNKIQRTSLLCVTSARHSITTVCKIYLKVVGMKTTLCNIILKA